MQRSELPKTRDAEADARVQASALVRANGHASEEIVERVRLDGRRRSAPRALVPKAQAGPNPVALVADSIAKVASERAHAAPRTTSLPVAIIFSAHASPRAVKYAWSDCSSAPILWFQNVTGRCSKYPRST